MNVNSRIAKKLQRVLDDLEDKQGLDSFDLQELISKLDGICGDIKRAADLLEQAWDEI